MCCCPKPNINGEVGYIWNNPGGRPGVYPVNPPDLRENETVLYDEPGRCGGIDSHSYHYRVVKWYSSIYLLVRHGGGDERLQISLYNQQVELLVALDSNSRYWMLNAMYHAYRDGKEEGTDKTAERWSKAAVEKRIKIRCRNSTVRVYIEPSVTREEPINVRS